MIAASYGTVEDIEILWAIIAFIGMIYSGLNLKEAYEDWKFVEDRKITNGRRVLSLTHLWSEAIRFLILTIFLTIGITAMTIPSVPPVSNAPENVVIIQALIRWGLIVSSCLLVFKTYLGKKARDEIKVGGHTQLKTNPNAKDPNESK